MDDESPSPGESDAATPSSGAAEPERRDAKAKAENLDAIAGANEQATWENQEIGRHVIPGIVSGDLGPKGRVSAQLRDLARREKSSYGEVPRGTTYGDGGFRFVLLPMLGIAVVCLMVVALMWWIAS